MSKSRLSFSHENPGLRGQNPLYAKTEPARPRFNDAAEPSRQERKAAYKLNRHGSAMVERDRPAPAHKPEPRWAEGADHTAYNDQLRQERRAAYKEARRAELLHGAVQVRDQLRKADTDLAAQQARIAALDLTSARDQKEISRLAAHPEDLVRDGQRALDQAREVSTHIRSFQRSR